MNREKKIKLIIFIIVIIVIALIGLLLIKKNMGQTNLPEEAGTDGENTELTTIDSTIKRVDIRNNYYCVKNAITKYFTILDKTTISQNGTIYSSEYVYSLLDNSYITEKNITTSNVLEKLPSYDKAAFYITDMYVTQRTFDISIYFVYGIVRQNAKISNFSLMVKMDRTNETFKIYPQDYVEEKYSNIKENTNIDFSVEEKVENSINNIFEFNNISNDTYVQDLFTNIKYYILYDNEGLYNMLDEEYKAKFSSYNDFYNYIGSMYLKLMKITLGGYNKINNSDGTTKYILTSSDEEFKIIVNETAPFKYTITIQ